MYVMIRSIITVDYCLLLFTFALLVTTAIEMLFTPDTVFLRLWSPSTLYTSAQQGEHGNWRSSKDQKTASVYVVHGEVDNHIPETVGAMKPVQREVDVPWNPFLCQDAEDTNRDVRGPAKVEGKTHDAGHPEKLDCPLRLGSTAPMLPCQERSHPGVLFEGHPY